MSLLREVGLAAAGLVAVAATVVLPASPAVAGTCGTGTGVSVVVDFSKVGGGVVSSCVAGGGGDTAARLFEVDHDLTRVQRFQGAVCRVDGAPGSADCRNMPPTNAYWGLFWSDGSGGWIYSSEGVDTLNVPDGGSVAFAWQDGGDRDEPQADPPQKTAQEPTSSPSPTGGGNGDGNRDGDGNGGGGRNGGAGGSSDGDADGGGGAGGGAGGGDDGAAGTSPGGSPSATSEGSPSATPDGPTPSATSGGSSKDAASAASDEPTGSRTDPEGRGRDTEPKDAEGERPGGRGADRSSDESGSLDPSPEVPASSAPAADPASAEQGGLPVWVAPAGIGSLFLAAGAAALLRRRPVS